MERVKALTLGLSLLASLATPAAKLEAYLPVVPPALARTYAAKDIRFDRGSELKVRLLDVGNRQSMEITYPRELTNGIPATELARELAEALVRRIAQKDNNHANLAIQLSPRLINAGQAFFLGRDNGDALAMSWWKLRMDVSSPKFMVAAGSPVLLIVKSGKGAEMKIPHGTVGLRYLGTNGDRDFIFNPGSNNPGAPLIERLLPIGGLKNTLTVWDLFNWLEAQRTIAYINLDIHAYRINKEQARFMELLAKEIEIAQWGNFNIILNNCANGTSDVVNSILPFDQTTSAEIDLTFFNKNVHEVQRAVDKRLPKLFNVWVDGVAPPAGKKPLFFADPVGHVAPSSTYTFRQYTQAEATKL